MGRYKTIGEARAVIAVESLPVLNAKLREQVAACCQTAGRIVALQLAAAEGPAPYGKAKRRAGRGRGPTPPPGTTPAVPPGGDLGPVAGGGA